MEDDSGYLLAGFRLLAFRNQHPGPRTPDPAIDKYHRTYG
jgi:hypothetical protein